MRALSVGACILAAAAFAWSVPLYEDNPRYFRKQYASEFTGLSELLFVKKQTRSHLLRPFFRCQAMVKKFHSFVNVFEYRMFYTTTSTPNRIVTFVTSLYTSTASPHNQPNALTFRTEKGGPFKTYKVMFADRAHRCFILVMNEGTNARACRLLRTARTVGQRAPVDCQKVYTQNCPRDSIEVYERDCWLQFARIIA
ncbi:uncharacterized protein LOC144105438 [Amblyomma americanum]